MPFETGGRMKVSKSSEDLTIWVLLATYNGASYLPDFLASLRASTAPNWALLVYDDGSQDETLRILQAFRDANPASVRWTCFDSGQRLGAKLAFSHLAQQAMLEGGEGDLFVFADQDDVWEPVKLEQLLESYMHARSREGDIPLLLHSDLSVIDSAGFLISSSLSKMQNSRPVGYGLQHALVQNSVTGCACMINYKLLALATPVPPQAIMHDWWLALVACAFGRVVYVPMALVQYRQHADNVVGARRYSFKYALRHLWEGLRGRSSRIKLSDLVVQARALRDHPDFSGAITGAAVVESFSGLPERSFLVRWLVVWRYGIARSGGLRNIMLAVDLLRL